MNQRCWRDFEHMPHKYMLGRELYRCDGGANVEEFVEDAETEATVEETTDDAS